MKRLFLSACISLCLCVALHAQIKEVSLLTHTPLEYEKTEWNIRLLGKWNNPFLQEDAALDMRVITPSGKKLSLPCYYESGPSGETSLWKARFTPQEAGKYTCRFEFSQSAQLISTSGVKTFVVKPSRKKGILHPGSNWIFCYDDGTPFRGIGENIGWESRTFDDSKYSKGLNENPKYNYGYMLPSLASHGGNFFRTWICSWNLPIDWKRGFNSSRYDTSSAYYNPSALKRMDWMIQLADSLGLHIMLTLGPGAYSLREGGLDSSAAEFFVDPASRTRYRNRLRYIIARWGYSPAIGAWELFNEVDNVMYRNPTHPVDPATIVRWHDEMSAYIKKTDPYRHLVTTSISHRDLPGLDTLHSMDFNQKHIYRNTRAIPPTIVQYENQFRKPYVIGEFSYEWDWSKDFNSFKDGMISDYKRGLWYGLFSPTPILPMSWWWEYFDSLGTDKYIAHVRAILDKMLVAGKGSFDTIHLSTSSPDLYVLGVKCKDEIFIYAYNPTNSNLKGDIRLIEAPATPLSLEIYDCETGQYKKAEDLVQADNKATVHLNLSPVSDKVFILEKHNSLKR